MFSDKALLATSSLGMPDVLGLYPSDTGTTRINEGIERLCGFVGSLCG